MLGYSAVVVAIAVLVIAVVLLLLLLVVVVYREGCRKGREGNLRLEHEASCRGGFEEIAKPL
ncbi:LOW QUALITY PROTEIN: hypothetical protein V1478_011509 [Vespula squamosa]|uniref:Uncharacterized protein n=1 Tax=Vespula squamosa TaxID=30214 RepID=A0ABD2AHC2_VESSQ